MNIDFEKIKYYPSLRSRKAEVVGYENLAEDVKSNILPMFTLGVWQKGQPVSLSVEKIQGALGSRPCIVDVAREQYANEETFNLTSSAEKFQNWRRFIRRNENFIPVVQMDRDTRVSEVVRQARYFEDNVGKLVFKVSDDSDVVKIIPALASLDSAENALIVIDAGLIRKNLMSMKLVLCINAINDIRSEVGDAIISIQSTSFPQFITSEAEAVGDVGCDRRGRIPILERELFEAIGRDVCLYGDYGSISRIISTGGRYTPRIDYARERDWVYERRPDTDSAGYVEAARALLRMYPEIKDSDTWGASCIMRVAGGDSDGMRIASNWISVRVNVHITTQSYISYSDDEYDEEDYEDL